jgi:hypothetical protein
VCFRGKPFCIIPVISEIRGPSRNIWQKAFPGLSLPPKNLSFNLYGKIRATLLLPPGQWQASLKIITL